MSNLNKGSHGDTYEDTFGHSSVDKKVKGLVNINKTMGGFMSRSLANEELSGLKNDILEALESTGVNGYKVLEIDGNKEILSPASAVVFTMETEYKGVKKIATHLIIIESTMKTARSKIIDVNKRGVEVIVTPGDLYTEMFNIANDLILRNKETGKEVEVLDAGCSVLPAGNEHPMQLLNNLLYTCVTACGNVLSTFDNSAPRFSVKDIDPKNDKLVARINYDRDNIEGYSLEPIRSDITIDLSSNTPTGQTIELTTLSSYIDLVYSPPAPPAYGQRPETQIYYPRQVITFCDTRVDALTLELQLLALSQATLLTEGLTWATQFRPKYFNDKNDITDIGAVGYELKIGDKSAKINTKAKDFDDNAFYQLITMAVHDDLIISMDIDEIGGNSWLNQTFLAAANGSVAANDQIVAAANALTDNKFILNYDPDQKVAIDDNNRIILGYYVDEKGNKRDLREFDYLAMLNLAGKTDPDLIIAWDESFNNTTIPMEIRLETRLKCLNSFLAGNVTVTGYARRITLEPKFIIALDAALSEAKLRVSPANVQQYTGDGTRRGLNNASRYTVQHSSVGKYFNRGYEGASSDQYYRGRFSR